MPKRKRAQELTRAARVARRQGIAPYAPPLTPAQERRAQESAAWQEHERGGCPCCTYGK